MNLKDLQQAPGERMRSLRTSVLVILLALGGLIALGLMARSQPPQVGTGAPTPVVRPSLPGPVRLQPPPPTSQASWPPGEEGTAPRGSSFVARLQGMLLVLTLVSLLVWAVLRLLAPSMTGMGRRPGSNRKLLNVLERQSLGPGKGLLVIEVAGRHLLLGMTEQSIQTLGELTAEEVRAAREVPDPPDPQPGTPAPGAPRNLLQEVLAQHLSALPGLSSRQRGS